MTCHHLRKLYEVCDQNNLRFSSSDLLHIVCKECDREEVCPSMLMGDFEKQDAKVETTARTAADNSQARKQSGD